jgi:hypothetical protein
MTKMLEVDNGMYVRRSDIVSISPLGKASDRRCEISMIDGSTYILNQDARCLALTFDYFDAAIPAHPGYFVVVPEPGKNGGNCRYKKVPVVGWVRFEPDECDGLQFFSRPVFAAKHKFDESDYESWGFVLPDGRVLDYSMEEYDSERKFVKARSSRLVNF